MKRPQLLLVGLLVSTVLLGQRATTADAQPAAKPIRIGAVGTQLTDQEVADLIKVLPDGGTPWLINGDGPGAFPSGMQRFQVYLLPISATPEARQGEAIEVTRPIGAPSAWSILKDRDGQQYRFDYAQVAIAGRRFDQIQVEGDSNRPFILSEGGDDAELVSVIKFVRAQYSSPIRGVRTRPPDELSHIESLRMAPGEVQVTLRQSPSSGDVLFLRKFRQSWEVFKQLTVNE